MADVADFPPAGQTDPEESGRAAKPDSRWSLTGVALDRLLALLDPDRERAGERYQGLRHRLDALFRWWGCPEGELADRTLDRVALKLAEGAAVTREALPAYVRGVARLVFYESLRERQRREEAAKEVALPAVADTDQERALTALDRCLETLEGGDRKLILSYYAAQEGDSTMDVRRRLASRLGLSPTALRIRAHRLRQRLEACLAGALDRESS